MIAQDAGVKIPDFLLEHEDLGDSMSAMFGMGLEPPSEDDTKYLAAMSEPFDVPQTYSIPESIDPRSWLEIFNQLKEGSCSGHGSTTVCTNEEYLDSAGKTIMYFSPRFTYIDGQKYAGITGDRGCTIAAVVQSLRNHGAIPRTDLPYFGNYAQDAVIPSGAYEIALRRKIQKQQTASGYDDIFRWISGGAGGCIIGIPWTQELAANQNGLIVSSRGRVLGGHCNAVVGYSSRKDEQGRNFLIQINSWGPTWGGGPKGGTAEVAPSLYDMWAQGGSELICVTSLTQYNDAPKRLSFLTGNPWAGTLTA